MIDYLFVLQILGGFVFLIKGADFLVEKSSLLATRLGMSQFLVGLLIVSIGTSLPELVVSIFSSIDGYSNLVFGNVIGSNLANVFFILGVFGLFYRAEIDWFKIKRDWWVNIGLVLLLMTFLNTTISFSLKEMSFDLVENSNIYLQRWQGVVFLVFFFMYFIILIKMRPSSSGLEVEDVVDDVGTGFLNSVFGLIVLIAISAGVVGLGGQLVVDGSLYLSKEILQIDEGVVGFTIVAIGTSLPELVTTLTAGKKQKSDMALGNILGSNTFNILWVLGVSVMIQPMTLPQAMNYDVLACFASLLIFLFLLKRNPKNIINLPKSLLMLVGYVGYMFYLVMRG